MDKKLPAVCCRCRKLKMPDLGDFRRVPGRCHDFKFVCHACSSNEKPRTGIQLSWLERRVVSVLVETDYRFVREHGIGHYRYDFFIPALGLLIEADSCKWHGRHRQQTRDKAKDRAAENSGYKLVRVQDPDLEGKVRHALDAREIEIVLD